MRCRGLASCLLVGLVAACGGSSSVDDQPAANVPPNETPSGSAVSHAAEAGAENDAGVDASRASSPHSLKENRDRLFDTLAKRKAKERCALWTALSATQKGVFLTISDLLGKRSLMTNDPTSGTALDHVVSIYEIRDKGSFGNGGGDNNRIFIGGDAALLFALRNFDGPLPEWAASTDAAGAHDPFDATSETIHGQPRGQAHFWSADDKAKALGRPGVETVVDPHVIEIDIDYDLFHQSNPEATYVPGGYGRTFYEATWKDKGIGGSAELDYQPTGCK
jgi:hypothetical protein